MKICMAFGSACTRCYRLPSPPTLVAFPSSMFDFVERAQRCFANFVVLVVYPRSNEQNCLCISYMVTQGTDSIGSVAVSYT